MNTNLDKLIDEINAQLQLNFAWLQNTYGIAQDITRKNPTGKEVKEPAVWQQFCYGHNNDYLTCLPNDTIGNHSFFNVEAIRLDENYDFIYQDFSLTIWLDLRKVFDANDVRDINYLKQLILKVLRLPKKFGRVTIDQISDNPRDIYAGYTYTEIEQQYLMHPYYALKFSGELRYNVDCLPEFEPVLRPAEPITPPINIK